jgi:hypothetical protein
LGSLPNFCFCSWFSGLQNTLGNSTTQAESLQTAYNSSQQELEELRAAALEACQGIEEGEVQAGSSMASRLRALGRHVTQRVRCALHLGVQKALGVVVSHYQVDLEVVSTGNVVPAGIYDEVAMNRADALAVPAADILAKDFMDFLFPDAPPAGGPKPEDHWAFVPFMFFVLAFEPRGYVINTCCLKHLDVCELKHLLFILAVVPFCLPVFLGESSAGKVSLAQVACRQSGKGEGPYPAGDVGYPRLALASPFGYSRPT